MLPLDARVRAQLAAHRRTAVANLAEALDDLEEGTDCEFVACPVTYTVEFRPSNVTILELGIIDDAFDDTDSPSIDTHTTVEVELFAWLGALWKTLGVPCLCRTAHVIWSEDGDTSDRPRYDLIAKAWRPVAVR